MGAIRSRGRACAPRMFALVLASLLAALNPLVVYASSIECVQNLSEVVLQANERMARVAMEIDDADNRIIALRQEIAESKASLENIDREKEETRRFLEECIVTLYEKRSEMSVFSLFVRSGSFADYLNNQRYVQELMSAFQRKLAEYEDMDVLIAGRQAALEKQLQELGNEKKKLGKRQERMEEEIGKLKEQLREAEAEDARVQEALERQIAAMRAQEVRELEAMQDPSVLGQSSGWAENRMYDGSQYQVDPYGHGESDLTLLAGIIQAEAGNQPYAGKVAVGSVVMNRVEDPRFPNTISGVIYSPKQFSPVASGRLAVILAQGPSAECIAAAQDVLNGTRNVSNLYFKSASYAAAHGITGLQIADQVFH